MRFMLGSARLSRLETSPVRALTAFALEVTEDSSLPSLPARNVDRSLVRSGSRRLNFESAVIGEQGSRKVYGRSNDLSWPEGRLG
jgi:hypothetical protein